MSPDDGKSGLAINVNYVKRVPAILKIVEFVSMLKLIFSEAAICRCSTKCVFLKVFQNLYKNTCVRLSLKEAPAQIISCEFYTKFFRILFL